MTEGAERRLERGGNELLAGPRLPVRRSYASLPPSTHSDYTERVSMLRKVKAMTA